MYQLSQEGLVNHHLLKSMVNKNMKWRMFLIHEYQRQLQYLRHFCKYDVNEHTWELTNHLMNVIGKVKKFHQ
jgi:DNA-directed RNA polymerase subunit F